MPLYLPKAGITVPNPDNHFLPVPETGINLSVSEEMTQYWSNRIDLGDIFIPQAKSDKPINSMTIIPTNTHEAKQ